MRGGLFFCAPLHRYNKREKEITHQCAEGVRVLSPSHSLHHAVIADVVIYALRRSACSQQGNWEVSTTSRFLSLSLLSYCLSFAKGCLSASDVGLRCLHKDL